MWVRVSCLKLQSHHLTHIYRSRIKLKHTSTFELTMSNPQLRKSALIPYVVPDWAKRLTFLPKYKVKLAHANTPIHKWFLPGVPDSFEISIKRDDLTGCTLSGNKVRKLEFLFADLIDKECSHVITIGGVQSNHCRAVAIASCQLGIQSHLLLRTDAEGPDDIGCLGNVLLDRMCGADVYITPKNSPQITELLPRQEKLAAKIKKETGDTSYLIPVGGSTTIGLFGYMDAFEELLSQGIQNDFDDIVVTCGSGGTAAGLCIGNYLTGSKLRCHGILVCDDVQTYYEHIQETLKAVGLADVKSEDIIDIIGGYKGRGYGVSTDEELKFISDVCMSTGIVLDPTYTGKAARGMLSELTSNPDRFQGKRILFIHTGGIYGLYDGRMDSTLTSTPATNRIKMWRDKNDSPPDN